MVRLSLDRLDRAWERGQNPHRICPANSCYLSKQVHGATVLYNLQLMWVAGDLGLPGEWPRSIS